jgi:hypothetical protein
MMNGGGIRYGINQADWIVCDRTDNVGRKQRRPIITILKMILLMA